MKVKIIHHHDTLDPGRNQGLVAKIRLLSLCILLLGFFLSMKRACTAYYHLNMRYFVRSASMENLMVQFFNCMNFFYFPIKAVLNKVNDI